MKLGLLLMIGLLISLVPYSSGEASQDTAVVDRQTLPEDYQPDEYQMDKEEDPAKGEATKRPRTKRRRRLRKRPRGDTEVERGDGGLGTERIVEEEEPAEILRRRPAKRRRRPHRRYQGDEGAPHKPLRRRRKGGRRRIRPLEESGITENHQEEGRNNIQEGFTEQPIPTTISTSLNAILEEEQHTEDPELMAEHNEAKTTNEEIVKMDIEDTTKHAEFGNKIFDRKKLFSNSRRTLPITSAVIRKLSPNRANNATGTTDRKSNNENSESKTDTKIADIQGKTMNDDGQAENQQEIEKQDEEEPNYPKFIPNAQYRGKIKNNETLIVQITTTTTTTTTSTTKKPETTKGPEIMTELPEFQDNQMTEIEIMLDNLDDESLNKTLLNDYILDLLNSKKGREQLTRILESRNMTLSQLLEHRERGSSKFHLLEMFPQRKKQSNSTPPTKDLPQAGNNSESLTDSKQIQFPSEDVLGSFPKFVSDEIEKHSDKNDNKIEDNETESSIIHESREPRHYNNGADSSSTSTTKENLHPTWRVIPNPRLRPVSTRGNYEEIPISNVLNKPLDSNDIYIVEEESIIHHKKLDRTKARDSFGKKIPVGVKSAIIISGIILAVATFGFLSLLVSCRVRQKRTLKRAKQDMMCEHLQNDDFMASQQSLSPVLTKHQQVYNPHHEHHHHHPNPNNRHYYLWRTIRRTFRYD